MIDWPKLLTQQGIEFIEHGPSASKGNIYVHCEFCGQADQGHHMGISLNGKGWGCWRQAAHRGKSPIKLLASLLNISWARAAEILGEDGPKLTSDNSMQALLKSYVNKDHHVVTHIHELKLPPEILPLYSPRLKNRIQAIFAEYLEDRSYPRDIQPRLVHKYKLHWALRGKWKYRIIFPIYTQDGLVTWTGRHVTPGVEPRYDTLTVDPDNAYNNEYYAKANIKDCLFNERWLYKAQGGKALIVGEGPFDAMRLDWNGWKSEVHGTCLFGKTISDIQLEKLYELGQLYDKRYILLDPDAELDIFPIIQRAKRAGYKPLSLVSYPNAEDIGALSNRDTREFIRKEILKKVAVT